MQSPTTLKNDLNPVSVAIIGLGNMGATHAGWIQNNEIPLLNLVAVCDASPDRLKAYPKLRHFTTPSELFNARCAEAVLIATPHYAHTDIGIAALQSGHHVLVEKPISVHKADCLKLLDAHRDKSLVFAAMFNQRTLSPYRAIRDLIQTGQLGQIRRIQWTTTKWYRTQAYYRSSDWKATWKGEGGGALLNQSPHQLDLLFWLFGQPTRVRAHCHFGKYHPIEVEDDVTAYLEFANGATATFITSTGEYPGTERLEIAGEYGKLILEDEKLEFFRNDIPMTRFSRETTEAWSTPHCERIEIPTPPTSPSGQHQQILQNFAQAIRSQTPLISPAAEGIHSVELANAMLLSTWLDQTITLPIEADRFSAELEKRFS